MELEPDWDEEAEEELRVIEAAYSAEKRKNSDSDCVKPFLSQRRRLPGWAKEASSPSGSASRNLFDGNGHLISKLPYSFSPIPYPANIRLKLPLFTFCGRTVYSRTFAEVEEASLEILNKIEQMKHKENEVFLGFDLEWKPNFIKGEAGRKTSVMQICMDSSDCYVMHIIHSGIPPILKLLLEDPSSSKVGIGIGSDASRISREYNISTAPLVDLSRYANHKLGGAPKNWGLCSLTETLACKQLLKSSKIRMSNWEVNELSKKQLQYAATDAFASWYLHQILKTFPDPNPKTS